MADFMLEISTPYRPFFTGRVESLVLPIYDGLFGVEAGHEPVVTLIESGTLRYQVNGEWHLAAVSPGIVEIMPHYVVVLVNTAEHPEEIDLNRAEEAKRRAEEHLRHETNMREYHRNKLALARAIARINTRKH